MFRSKAKAAATPSKADSTNKSGARKSGGNIPSIISADMDIVGTIVSDGVVDIDGSVDGNVRCQSVTIRKNGVIKGDVIAETVHVYGTVKGLIKAQSVQFFRGCLVEGVIMHETLAIEDGAFVDGRFKRVEKLDLDSNAESETTTPKPAASSQKTQASGNTSGWQEESPATALTPATAPAKTESSAAAELPATSKKLFQTESGDDAKLKAPTFLMNGPLVALSEDDSTLHFTLKESKAEEKPAASEKQPETSAEPKGEKRTQKVRVLENLRLISDAG